jgi:hypothetical protein
MPLSLLILPLLAGAPAPVTVTGYAWAPFISPMGEPFRSRAAGDDTLANWFYQADRNRDGSLTLDEMQADADRFFATLDTNNDGQIDPDELIEYEWQVAPEIQVNSKLRRARGDPAPPQLKDSNAEPSERRRAEKQDGLQGGARYALINMPEPVAAADTDLNRTITRAEFRQAAAERFQLLDSKRQNRIELQQLIALRDAMIGKHKKGGKDEADGRVGVPLPPRD